MNEQLQASLSRSFSQADFDRFAKLSGDDNPIHTDPEFSARARFGRPVAHGLLLCSVLRGLIEKLAPGGRVTDQSVMFPAPTFAGEPMRFVVTVTGRSEEGKEAWLDCRLEVLRAEDGVETCLGHGKVVL
jgi:acyl dehydratase